MARKKREPGCKHTSVMYIPTEDDPEIMAEFCLQCQTVLAMVGPDDEDLLAAYESLIDPDPDGPPRRRS